MPSSRRRAKFSDWATRSMSPSGSPSRERQLSGWIPRGKLYLRSGQDPTVTVLDPDGGFVRYIGGSGEGPGEFTLVVGHGFAADTLWLQGWPELHVSFFDSAGTHIKTETDHGVPSYLPELWRTSTPLARGHGFYIPPIGHADPERGILPNFKRVKLPMLVGSRSGSSRDTLGFRYNVTTMIIEEMGRFGHQPIITPPLYGIRPNGDGVVTADWEPDRPDELILRHYDVNGRVVREVAIGSRLRKVSAEAREAFMTNACGCAMRPRRRGPKPSGSSSARTANPGSGYWPRPASPSKPPSTTASGELGAPNWMCPTSCSTSSASRMDAGSWAGMMYTQHYNA